MVKSTKPPLAVVGATAMPPASDPLHGLGEHGRTAWQLITNQYQIDDAGGRMMLHEICAARDRLVELQQAIDRDGAIVKSRSGVREHPAIKLELQLRAFICRTLVRLGLSVEAINPSAGRPARPTGWRGFE
jgi:hypothetical protein